MLYWLGEYNNLSNCYISFFFFKKKIINIYIYIFIFIIFIFKFKWLKKKIAPTTSTTSPTSTVQEIEDPKYKSENTNDGITIKKYGSIIITNFIVMIIMKILFF